ncbi:hypothetical protein P2318_07235 [Myxococcaceae bacterium GXIMD 01537]
MRGTLPTLRLTLLLGLAGAGCHRAAPTPSPEPRAAARPSLVGRTLPLLTSPALRLTVAGVLGGKPVPVVLDIARPLTTAATACFGEALPRPEGTVRAPEPSGGMREWAMVPLQGLRLGDVTLPSLPVGVAGERACAVTLGMDVLGPYALTVDPVRREVSFSPSRPRADYAAELAAAGTNPAVETHLVELTREPLGDWPLLPAQVTQGEARVTGPFVLGSREPFSRLSTKAAEAQALRPLETQAGLPPRAFQVDSVEVARDVGVGPLALEAGDWRAPGSLGRLGPDVWGRFRATIDAQGEALVLQRPRVQGPEAGPQQCARAGAEGFSEEACYALHTRVEAGGAQALTLAVFRDLPEGGRLHVEPLGADGKPLGTGCRVGFVFAPGGRGQTTQHRIPSSSLAQSVPECHAELAGAKGYRLVAFEDGALPECNGRTCAFVQDLRTRRTACECQPTPLGEGVVAGPRKPAPSRAPPPEEREREPEDPR